VPTFFSKLRPCVFGLEACATAHDWPRELAGGATLGDAVAGFAARAGLAEEAAPSADAAAVFFGFPRKALWPAANRAKQAENMAAPTSKAT
jgi:hypothetical protein